MEAVWGTSYKTEGGTDWLEKNILREGRVMFFFSLKMMSKRLCRGGYQGNMTLKFLGGWGRGEG